MQSLCRCLAAQARRLLRSSACLCARVQYQAMARHGQAWKESLRERPPALDAMCGLRRVTLNANPLLEDRGALELADALQYEATCATGTLDSSRLVWTGMNDT